MVGVWFVVVLGIVSVFVVVCGLCMCSWWCVVGACVCDGMLMVCVFVVVCGRCVYLWWCVDCACVHGGV